MGLLGMAKAELYTGHLPFLPNWVKELVTFLER